MSGVDGRVVVVTGAGQGIGRGMATHLAKHGAAVVVVDWKAHRVERTVGELEASGLTALGLACDIGDHSSILDMVAHTMARFGRVDA
jgi:NAD(P)-dependent dehydrogenase (short-subunit alcohol dehydrogenase family)